MRTSIIGLAVSSALLTPDTGGEVVVSGSGEKVEGTVITKDLRNQAGKALKAAWNIADKIFNVASMVLALGQSAVKEANGDFKLALAKFDAAVASAVVDFREEHKESDAETKGKMELFLASDGLWYQYVGNITGALKEAFPIQDYSTESALRRARKAAKDMRKASRTVKAKLEDKLDMSEITPEQFSEAFKKADGNPEAVEKELRKLGAVEMEAEEEMDDERRDRIHNEAKAQALYFVGDGDSWTGVRESVTKLLSLLAEIPVDAGHEGQIKQALDNAYIQVAKAVKIPTDQQPGRATPPTGSERRVQSL